MGGGNGSDGHREMGPPHHPDPLDTARFGRGYGHRPSGEALAIIVHRDMDRVLHSAQALRDAVAHDPRANHSDQFAHLRHDVHDLEAAARLLPAGQLKDQVAQVVHLVHDLEGHERQTELGGRFDLGHLLSVDHDLREIRHIVNDTVDVVHGHHSPSHSDILQVGTDHSSVLVATASTQAMGSGPDPLALPEAHGVARQPDGAPERGPGHERHGEGNTGQDSGGGPSPLAVVISGGSPPPVWNDSSHDGHGAYDGHGLPDGHGGGNGSGYAYGYGAADAQADQVPIGGASPAPTAEPPEPAPDESPA